MAADYSATAEYEGGNLYYKAGRNGTCKNIADGINVSTSIFNSLENTTIQFYTDNRCRTSLKDANRQNVTINGDVLFAEGATASIYIAKDGTITLNGAPQGPKPPASSSSIKSSSSSAVRPGQPGQSSSSTNRPGQPGQPDMTGKKTIAFFTPWSNTNAVLFMGGDSVATMKSLKNYCGWFTASITPPASDFKVYFKQTVGLNYVGAEGMTTEEPSIANEIVLDTFPEYKTADTIWVQGYKTDAPAVFFKYPGVLGDCPLKKFPVTMFDWGAGVKTGVSEDFESGGCAGSNNGKGFMEGMVQEKLGPKGVPVRADPFPKDCRLTEHLNSWFLPEVVATDDAGNEYTNMTCRDLYISMDDEGFWLAEVSSDKISEGNEKNKGGMFLLDDFQYLDEAKTIENPYFDWLNGSGTHNFSFTMKVQAKFEYVPGQYFDFYGDDDVWVFINNRLAVDIGGQHRQVAGAVNLDTIGQTNPAEKLIPGNTYDFHIFYVERHTSSSNFRMRTSIDLQVEASMFVTSDKIGDVEDYKIWQINKKSKFSCGYDASSTETDTTGGASTFKLTGGNLSEPQVLGVGLHFEGLNITSDSTFSVNVEAIKAGGALAPGHYFLEITLKEDPSQMTKVEITIPAYDIPTVAFAKADWTILGKEVSGDTLQIGDFAYATYQVNITFFEDWAQVNNYNRKINLSFSDVNVDILDGVGGKKITSVNLDSSGRATFYVHANAPVSGATLTAKGAAAGASVWTNLNFIEPPIPQVVNAIIFDRNGDGRADSLYVLFDRTLKGKSTLDSIQFTFGESFNITQKFRIEGENAIVAVAESVSPSKCSGDACGFGSKQFTGGATAPYLGKLNSWFTYQDNGKSSQFHKENDEINDGVGPIILSAVKSKSSDGSRQLTLTFSEAISDESRDLFETMFEFICMRSGVNEAPESPVQQAGDGNTMTLVYSTTTQDAILPTNGDLIRFVADAGTADLFGNKPHANNPWATITGDQELSNESPSIIAVGKDPYGIIKNDTITQSMLITDVAQDAQQIGDSLGVQGSLIDYDISKIMLEETQKDINALDAFIEANLGSVTTYDTSITSITDDEALNQVFADISAGVVAENFGFSEETVNAIMAGDITVDNYLSKLPDEEIAIIAKLTQDNIDASRDTVITITDISTTTQADLFQAIKEGKLDEDLLEAGISQTLIDAIKNGDVNEFNLEEFRNGSASLISDDAVELYYRTRYYSQFGEYVGGTSSSIKCSDKAVYGEEGCLKNKGRIFLAWNMRSDNGRLVGTGVYIARLEIKIRVNGKTTLHQTRDKLWGVRRGKINELGLDL